MSFQFSPETFLVEITRELEDLNRLVEEKTEELPFFISEVERLRKLARDLKSTSAKAVLDNATAKRDKTVKEIGDLKLRLKDLLNRQRIFETEIQVRQINPPIDINLDEPAPILTRELQPTVIVEQGSIPLKELAILGGVLLLLT